MRIERIYFLLLLHQCTKVCQPQTCNNPLFLATNKALKWLFKALALMERLRIKATLDMIILKWIAWICQVDCLLQLVSDLLTKTSAIKLNLEGNDCNKNYYAIISSFGFLTKICCIKTVTLCENLYQPIASDRAYLILFSLLTKYIQSDIWTKCH